MVSPKRTIAGLSLWVSSSSSQHVPPGLHTSNEESIGFNTWCIVLDCQVGANGGPALVMKSAPIFISCELWKHIFFRVHFGRFFLVETAKIRQMIGSRLSGKVIEIQG